MRKKTYTIEDVKKSVVGNQSIAGVLRQLGLKPLGGNYRTINRIISEQGIDTSHFTGKGWNVGLRQQVEQFDIVVPKLSCVDK